MSRKYKFHDQDKLYLIFLTNIHWINVFILEEIYENRFRLMEVLPGKKGLEIYGWCIMPSHVHMIIESNKNKLEDVVHDMKSFTSTSLKKYIKENVQDL